MNCKTVQANLSAFVDRESGPYENAQIRAHLADCEFCRSEEQDLRCLKALLTAIPAPDPRPGFETRLIAHIHGPRKAPASRLFRSQTILFVSVAAVTMLVVLQRISGTRPASHLEPARSDVMGNVQRDQVYEASVTDPMYGAAVFTPAADGR